MLHINSCSLPAQSSLPYVEAIGKNGGVLSVISVICGRTSVLVHETKKLSNIRLCIIITLWIIHITRMASGCFYNANLASSVDSYLTPTIDQRLNLRCFFGNIMSEDLASYRWMFSLITDYNVCNSTTFDSSCSVRDNSEIPVLVVKTLYTDLQRDWQTAKSDFMYGIYRVDIRFVTEL